MKHFFTSLFMLLVALALGKLTPLRAQTLDPTFQATTLKVPYTGGLQTSVQLTLVQPDGKVLIAGGFDFANGTLASKIMRLNADGSVDGTFNPGGTGANGFIVGMALQPDGKIIIVGGFTTYNGTSILAQARLNANGTLDASFAGLPLTGLRQLGSVAVQPDGKILVGSTAGFSVTPLPTVQRLNANGTPDASFTPPASTVGDFVRTILVQADGKILLGGSGGNISSALSAGLQRLNADGSIDSGFSSPFASSTYLVTYALAQQPDGKLLVGGSLARVAPPTPALCVCKRMDNSTTPLLRAAARLRVPVRQQPCARWCCCPAATCWWAGASRSITA
ncbi:delta-60 repeat domain-containing protein [Hymenobacter sp. BRD67]|nr:delta-60 repeat domain-containing protein [Hymenobacter sp. BRD67]QKG54448.1 delta-60 repeat domain-containing protein [Hymenobacter sp. BRD67]